VPANHRARSRLLGASLLVSLALLVACASEEAAPSTPPATAAVSPTTTPEPTTLLSGRVGEDHRVLAVKIDNTVNAHPQSGVVAADLVYLEEVEYGLTRLLAVYSSRYPKVVGPVRSARIADLELLRQFGEPAFAYSGANPRLVPLLRDAPLLNVSDDISGEGYWRQDGRTAPWDLFADPGQLLARAPHADWARDVGFTFSDDPPLGGSAARQVTVAWPGSSARFRWDADQSRWRLWADGQPAMATEGPQLGGTTVIVQLADVYPSDYGDAYGGVTPMTETVGRGRALVLRDGRVYRCRWARKTAEDGTTWTYRGAEMPMAPGQIWVALLDNDRRPVVR
jgi:hypothetical protein